MFVPVALVSWLPGPSRRSKFIHTLHVGGVTRHSELKLHRIGPRPRHCWCGSTAVASGVGPNQSKSSCVRANRSSSATSGNAYNQSEWPSDWSQFRMTVLESTHRCLVRHMVAELHVYNPFAVRRLAQLWWRHDRVSHQSINVWCRPRRRVPRKHGFIFIQMQTEG